MKVINSVYCYLMLLYCRIKEDYSPEIEGKLKAQFPEAKDVRHCTVDKLTVVTFPNQEVAHKAVRTQGESDLYSPVNVMLVSEVGFQMLMRDISKRDSHVGIGPRVFTGSDYLNIVPS